jgi:hypothetical protein
MYFRIQLHVISHLYYSKNKKKKKKKKKRKQSLPPVEPTVGSMKPPFQLAVGASQTAANHTGPAAAVAILPLVQTAAGTNRHLRRR